MGFFTDNDVKFVDFVSGGKLFCMTICPTGGVNAYIIFPMLLFKNVSFSYPIRGLENSVLGVLYRTY